MPPSYNFASSKDVQSTIVIFNIYPVDEYYMYTRYSGYYVCANGLILFRVVKHLSVTLGIYDFHTQRLNAMLLQLLLF
jgi:hypothetical protein